MKNFWKQFFLRGCVAAGSGPLVLAVIYVIMDATGAVETLSPREVVLGILTLTLLAFVAAGLGALYRCERLPLMGALAIHGAALYFGYIATYLINGWLRQKLIHILVFTAIFFVGFLLIWLVIYLTNKRRTEELNQKLHK